MSVFLALLYVILQAVDKLLLLLLHCNLVIGLLGDKQKELSLETVSCLKTVLKHILDVLVLTSLS